MRTKRFKLKHAFQAFVLLLICFWLIYQVKKSYSRSKVRLVENLEEKSVKEQDGEQVLKLGRKDLNPLLLDELAAEFQKTPDEDLEQEEDEGKNQENEGEIASNDGDDETDGVGEHEQLEEIIDEDDKDARSRRDAV